MPTVPPPIVPELVRERRHMRIVDGPCGLLASSDQPELAPALRAIDLAVRLVPEHQQGRRLVLQVLEPEAQRRPREAQERGAVARKALQATPGQVRQRVVLGGAQPLQQPDLARAPELYTASRGVIPVQLGVLDGAEDREEARQALGLLSSRGAAPQPPLGSPPSLSVGGSGSAEPLTASPERLTCSCVRRRAVESGRGLGGFSARKVADG
ncbi:hypothetical protein DL768_007892 [Monosporascus sp. mg162]|nr:hypothetical protein DL768_007892 [Monosporascus sp. mg162]